MLKSIPLAEARSSYQNRLSRRAVELRNGFTLGHWRFNPRSLTLTCRCADGYEYEVDLERMSRTAQVLDWIAQVAGKLWVTPEIVGELVLALDHVLRLQSTYCGCGCDLTAKRPVNTRELVRGRSSPAKPPTATLTLKGTSATWHNTKGGAA